MTTEMSRMRTETVIKAITEGASCLNDIKTKVRSKGGFTEGLLQAQERGEVRLLTLDDIFK